MATITQNVKVTADAVHSEDPRAGATRDGAMVAVEATITRALGVEVGVKRSAQSATNGASAAPSLRRVQMASDLDRMARPSIRCLASAVATGPD